MIPLVDKWSLILSQIRTLGKWLVKDDIHDFGYFTYFDRNGHEDHPLPLHHWQYGLMLWMASEYLTLMNMFYPFDKQIEKAKIKNKIKELKKKNAKQPNTQFNRQNALRKGWQIYSSLDG